MKFKLSHLAAISACALALAAVPASAADREPGAQRPLRSELPLLDSLRAVTSPATATDPVGDTFGPAPQTDATSLTATFGGGVLEISATFATPISVPDQGQDNALDGFIDIDADQNGNTGRISNVDVFNNESAGLGNEFFIDLFTYNSADGRVTLVDDVATADVARVPLTLTDTSFTVRIPLSALGGDDGRVNVALLVGNNFDHTDVVPNQGSVASSPGQVSSGCTRVETGDVSPCVADATTLCLTNDRFEVTASFVTDVEPDGEGETVELTSDTGYFWFFDESNVEVVVKVLDACVVNDHFWLFAGGLTNVEVEMVVRDTETGVTQICVNPPETPFQPIQRTNAFDTCP